MSKKRRANGKHVEEEATADGSKARLNLLIDANLKRWAHRYAKKKCTSITQLVTGYFVDLREREKDVDVEQI